MLSYCIFKQKYEFIFTQTQVLELPTSLNWDDFSTSKVLVNFML
jgi:hypothetical protein